MQQCLPLAVLKLYPKTALKVSTEKVATVLTACGIETIDQNKKQKEEIKVATVLTACGIETSNQEIRF